MLAHLKIGHFPCIHMRDQCHPTLKASLTFSMMHSSLGLLVSGHAQQGLSFLPSGPTGPSLGGVQGVSLAASIPSNSTKTLWNQMVESQICGNYPVLGINDCKQPNFEMHLRWSWWHGQVQYNWCFSSINNIDLHHDKCMRLGSDKCNDKKVTNTNEQEVTSD